MAVELNWQTTRAQVRHETQWGCRGMATFYPPMSWLPHAAACTFPNCKAGACCVNPSNAPQFPADVNPFHGS